MNELRIRREECPIQIHPVRSCECPRRGARTGRGQHRLDGVADVGATGRGPDVGVLPGLGDGLGDGADLLRCGVAGVQYSADRGISGRGDRRQIGPQIVHPLLGGCVRHLFGEVARSDIPCPGFPEPKRLASALGSQTFLGGQASGVNRPQKVGIAVIGGPHCGAVRCGGTEGGQCRRTRPLMADE